VLHGTAVVLLALPARRLGLAKVQVALALVIGVTAVLAAHAARGLRRSAKSLGGTVALVTGIVAASLTPALRTLSPGRPLLSTQLDGPGRSAALPPGISGRVRLLVRGDLPSGRPAHVAFILALGSQRLEGTLEHGTTRWRVGEETGHYHLRRSSIYVDGSVAAGVSELTLVQLVAAAPVSLRIEVYRDVVPPWFALGLAGVALLCAAWAAGPKADAERTVALSGTALTSGLLTGWLATPDRATWPAVVSLALGTFLGIASGALASRATSWVRRRWGLDPGRAVR